MRTADTFNLILFAMLLRCNDSSHRFIPNLTPHLTFRYESLTYHNVEVVSKIIVLGNSVVDRKQVGVWIDHELAFAMCY